MPNVAAYSPQPHQACPASSWRRTPHFPRVSQAPNLTLAVIDEQHRFGVEQRESLNSKGATAPHLLVMTATPIPRTAAMTWFGDLDISALTELPGGRKPIRTFVVPESNASLMSEMFALIRKRIDASELAYVVCPRIDDESENADDVLAESATSNSKTTGSPIPAFDEAYDLGEDDEQRAQRPPVAFRRRNRGASAIVAAI